MRARLLPLLLLAVLAPALPACDSPQGWASGFDAQPWYSEWDGHDPTQAQPQFWPQSPPIAAIDPASEGVPPSPVGGRVMRFPLSTTDAAAGRIHSKLFKTWNINAAGNGRPGLDGNVSGQYAADVFWPTSRSLSCARLATTLLFGWKEVHGSIQDSTYWIAVVPRCWIDGYRYARWSGSRPSDPDAPVALVRYWNWGRGSPDASRNPLYVAPVPRGRWFQVTANLYDHDRIDWSLDGASLGTSRDSEYPVGPQYGRAAADRWQLEVGNYGNAAALGTTYVDDVFFRRF
jgi:hypothetical protein